MKRRQFLKALPILAMSCRPATRRIMECIIHPEQKNTFYSIFHSREEIKTWKVFDFLGSFRVVGRKIEVIRDENRYRREEDRIICENQQEIVRELFGNTFAEELERLEPQRMPINYENFQEIQKIAKYLWGKEAEFTHKTAVNSYKIDCVIRKIREFHVFCSELEIKDILEDKLPQEIEEKRQLALRFGINGWLGALVKHNPRTRYNHTFPIIYVKY